MRAAYEALFQRMNFVEPNETSQVETEEEDEEVQHMPRENCEVSAETEKRKAEDSADVDAEAGADAAQLHGAAGSNHGVVKCHWCGVAAAEGIVKCEVSDLSSLITWVSIYLL